MMTEYYIDDEKPKGFDYEFWLLVVGIIILVSYICI